MAPVGAAGAVPSGSRRRNLNPKPLFDEPSLRAFLVGHGVKPVHMGKIWKHVLANLDEGKPPGLDEVPGIPDRIREPLAREFAVTTSTLVETHVSEIDGTMKLLIRLQDGGEIEAVVIHHSGIPLDADQRQAERCGERDTLCVSSQVGCRLGCTFCATGTMGLQGNLWPGEIQEQLVHARLIKGHSTSICNVVFMGMGEPLENFEAVCSSIRGMVDPFRFGIAPSSITVSTVGSQPRNMRRLLEDLPKVKMAVSLHAPNQALREQLVPAAKVLPINDLLAIVDEHALKMTGESKKLKMVMVSYVLLKGVNDSEENAKELAELLKGRQVIVNLIPYNPFEGNVHEYEEPSPEAVDAFLKVLANAELRVFERRHHGRDIAAACGQLAKLGGKGIQPTSTNRMDIEDGSCNLNKESDGVSMDRVKRPVAQVEIRESPAELRPSSFSRWMLLPLTGAAAALAAGLLLRKYGRRS